MNGFLSKGAIYVNQTKRYLVPILRNYGSSYMKKMSDLAKLGVGYDDKALKNVNNEILNKGYNIYFLIDSSVSGFNGTLLWFREQEYYAFDYEFDDIMTGYQHMIVLKFPEEFHHSYDAFLNGKYSKMLNEKDIKRFIMMVDQRLVYTRSKVALQRFSNIVLKEYGVKIDIATWKGEADFPPFESQEIFNYEKGQHI